MNPLETLFQPIKIGSLEIKNRIVMPPMHSGYAGADGSVSERLIDYYEARAKGGAGLIIVEVATPNADRKYVPNTLGFFDDAFIPGWRPLVESVKRHGAKIAVQLTDPGPGAYSRLSGVPNVGPSPVAQRDIRETPRQLTLKEIREIVRDFANAAERAKKAGLDAVEIHAAHQYAMLGSFLSAIYNKRTDAYGGSLEGRVKLLADVLKGVRDKVGGDFPVIVRISGDDHYPGGRTLQETQIIAPMIVEAGADALEISGGTVPEKFVSVVPPAGTPLAVNADCAAGVKQMVDVPVICVGRINSPRVAEYVLKTGKADLVSMGRALIADPDLPRKAEEGRFEDIAPCVADNQGCLVNPFKKKPASCLINPARGREREMEPVPTANPKRLLVVGGGPAGLEAARVAAVRGHEVVLCEKEEILGGQINIASIPPGKQELSQLVQYLSRQCEKAGVEIRLNTEVTPAEIKALKPDAVVVATGALPLIPDAIPGIDRENVINAWDVLAGKVERRVKNAVIVGGGSVGCETADFLASSGDNLMVGRTSVTIVEMLPEVAFGTSTQARHLLMQRLRAKGVRILRSTKVKEIVEKGVVVTKKDREEILTGVDWVITATGVKSLDKLSTEIGREVEEFHVIGDARKARSAIEAVAEGRETGLRLFQNGVSGNA